MVPVELAKQLILQNVEGLEMINIGLEDAEGYILGSDIISPVDMPLFNQSSMDGYAVAFNESQTFEVIGEVQAGQCFPEALKVGEAVRIFTGAPVPDGADAVIMQENTQSNGKFVSYQGLKPEQNEHIRLKGEQIKAGETALKKGESLTPAAIGFLASLGIGTVKVFKKPSVALIITGNELQKPGHHLKPAMVYESNSTMLKAALLKSGIREITVAVVKDDENSITGTLMDALNTNDLVILSGGISVGKFDFSKTATEKAGIETLFYQVSQKPGKPLFFGKKGNKIVFALPGNPSAALTCFYEYVFPSLNLMQNRKNPFLVSVNLPLKENFFKSPKLSFFLKGIAGPDGFEILEGQGSHMLRSFSQANCIVYIPAEKTGLKAGELVETHLLPF